MQTKKTEKADLEKMRTSFFQIGLAGALAITLVSFEWMTPSFRLERYSALVEDPFVQVAKEEIVFEQPKANNPTPQPEISESEEFVVDEIPAITILKPQETTIFENVSIPIIGEENFSDTAIIENIYFPPTFPAGPGFNGILPHFKACDGLNPDEIFDCVNDNMKIFLRRNLVPPHNLPYNVNASCKVTFTINEYGDVSEIYIHKEDKLPTSVAKEIRRVFNKVPQFIPGSQGGKPIKARYTIPIVISNM